MTYWLLSVFWVCFASASEGVSVEAWVSNSPDRGVGTLVIQMEIPNGFDVQWPEPSVEGLRFTESGEPQTERFGTSSVVRRTFRFSGPAGHYEIPSLTVTWTTDDEAHTASSNAIFVDIEKDPIRSEALSDISEPEKIWILPSWVKWTGAVFGLMLLLGGGVIRWIRRMPDSEDAVDESPPDVVAIQSWEAVRANQDLSEYDKAVEISRIFRQYTEVVLGFAATAWTTREILDRLMAMKHLQQGNVPRAKRLLRATDRIKFADASAAKELFDDLDADLRGFVGSTRPVQWGERE